jgi:hypothetical protein
MILKVTLTDKTGGAKNILMNLQVNVELEHRSNELKRMWTEKAAITHNGRTYLDADFSLTRDRRTVAILQVCM